MAEDDSLSITDNSGGDSFTETTHTGWFGRLGGSIGGMFVGLLMFVGSFVLLYWNEGRAVDAIVALDAGAKTVVSAPASPVNPANEGRLVHVTGPAAAPGPLQDPVFKVGSASALRLERKVEMYQWRESEETKTDKSLGGGETKTTTYTYSKEWADHPVDSSSFKKRDGHANPSMPYRSATTEARGVTVGAYALDPSVLQNLSAFENLAPSHNAALPQGFRWEGEQLFRGASSERPQVGDVRVSFRVVPAQTLSVVAGQTNGTLTGFQGERGRTIAMVQTGVHPANAMFADAKKEEAVLTWILRAVGFGLMLIGTALVASPLVWLASLIPFLDTLVSGAAFVVALVVSVPLTLGTIALAWLVHRPLIGGGILLAAILATVVIRKVLPARRAAMRTA